MLGAQQLHFKVSYLSDFSIFWLRGPRENLAYGGPDVAGVCERRRFYGRTEVEEIQEYRLLGFYADGGRLFRDVLANCCHLLVAGEGDPGVVN